MPEKEKWQFDVQKIKFFIILFCLSKTPEISSISKQDWAAYVSAKQNLFIMKKIYLLLILAIFSAGSFAQTVSVFDGAGYYDDFIIGNSRYFVS